MSHETNPSQETTAKQMKMHARTPLGNHSTSLGSQKQIKTGPQNIDIVQNQTKVMHSRNTNYNTQLHPLVNDYLNSNVSGVPA